MYKNKVVSLITPEGEKRQRPVKRPASPPASSDEFIGFDEDRLEYLLQEDTLIKKEAAALLNRLTHLEEQAANIDRRVNAVHTSLSQMETLTNPDFEQRILRLNQQIELLEAGLSAVREEMSGLWEALAQVKKGVKAACLEFNALDCRSKTIYEELVAMEKSLHLKNNLQ